MQRRFFLVSLYLVPTDWPHFRSPRADTNYQFEWELASSLLAHLRVTKISMQIYREGVAFVCDCFLSFTSESESRARPKLAPDLRGKMGALFTD